MNELAGIIGGAFVAAVTAWLTGYLDLRLPPPARVQLALRNLFASPQVPKDRFRIVLCWLKHDRGKDGETVGCAFSTVDGIDLVRSARLVETGVAADDWVPAMREGALMAMNSWAADLAVVGLVRKPGKILSLWFVRCPGGDTFHREDHTFTLEDVDSGPGFNDDLNTQLVAAALEAVAPLATTEARSQVLERTLTNTGNKIGNLLESGGIEEPSRLVKLHNAHGIVLRSLGELRGESEWLAQAVNSHNEALALLKREDQPVAWAQMQNRLGGALRILGGMENDRERLVQAVAALNAALTVYTQTDTPIDWANTQNNLGNALHALGHLEESTERLEQARLVLK